MTQFFNAPAEPGTMPTALWTQPWTVPLVPGQVTPEVWRDRLNRRLDDRQGELLLYDAYYYGEHRLAYATSKYREAFGNLFSAWSDNWCDVVCDAAVERLNVQGFTFGKGKLADDDAWTIWQENDLDATSDLAHLEAIKSKESYLIVAPPEKAGDEPQITVESPIQVIVEVDPANRKRRLAALKKWVDESGRVLCTLYLPDGIYRWESIGPGQWSSASPLGIPVAMNAWQPRKGAEFRTNNPLGVVPVIPLCNDPTLIRGGRSDIRRIIPIQDAVNKILNDGLIASEFGAFQQRVLMGVEVARDEQGKPIPLDELRSALSRLWVFEDKDATATTFPAVDLENFHKFAEVLLQHLAAQSRTPIHYFLGSMGAFPSGESLKSAETPLVTKVKRKMKVFGEAWEEAMRLAFLLKGDKEKGEAKDCEVVWGDPETRTESERADALVKRRSLGIPLEAIWREAGYTPQQVAEFKEMREREQDDETLFTLTPQVRGVKPVDPTNLGASGLTDVGPVASDTGNPSDGGKGAMPKPKASGIPAKTGR
jgi:hypothetical protein